MVFKNYSNFSNTFMATPPVKQALLNGCVHCGKSTLHTICMHWCSTNCDIFVLAKLQVFLFDSTEIAICVLCREMHKQGLSTIPYKDAVPDKSFVICRTGEKKAVQSLANQFKPLSIVDKA